MTQDRKGVTETASQPEALEWKPNVMSLRIRDNQGG